MSFDSGHLRLKFSSFVNQQLDRELTVRRNHILLIVLKFSKLLMVYLPFFNFLHYNKIIYGT